MSKERQISFMPNDILRLEQANTMMRSANRALAVNDLISLSALGFTDQHIYQLRQTDGFRSSLIGQNTRMITRLRRLGDIHAE